VKEETQEFAAWADAPETFRQQVRMAAVQVAGLRPEELVQALAYEVEPFSRIPATEAEVTYRPVEDADPTVRVYEVAVRRRADRTGRTSGAERWLKPAYVLAAVVVAVAAADGVLLTRRRGELEKSVAACRPLQARLDRLQTDVRTASERAAAVRSRREEAARAQEEAADLRKAHADLLADFATTCGTRAVVTSIGAGEGSRQFQVRAVGVSAEAAADVMQALTECIAPRGWRLTPETIAVRGAGTAVDFGFGVSRER